MRNAIVAVGLLAFLLFASAQENLTTATSSTATETSSTTSTAQVSTTPQPPSTTTSSRVENSSIPGKLPTDRTTSFACFCDLTLQCDLNCCCDLDCSEGILRAFRCELEGGRSIDDYNRDGLERCEVDNGLFCVMDASGARDVKFKTPLYLDYNSYKWPKASSIDHEPPHESSHDFYKFDDEIVAFDPRTDEVGTINVPMGFADSTCLSESVRFLKSKVITCLVSITQLCSYNANLIQQLLNLRLFRQPSKKAESREVSDVFSINIQSCKHSFANCTQILVSNQEEANEEAFDEVRMEFLVNDTSITSCVVSFISNEDLVCGIEEYGLKKAVQKIEVVFRNVKEMNTRRIRQFSRGYNDGELISASRLRLVNETATEGETILDYLRNETNPEQDFYLKIPTSRKGFCVLTNETFDLIRLNENSQTTCTVSLAKDEQLNSSLCDQFKRQIYHHQLNMLRVNINSTKPYADIYVSKFWTPRNEIASWSRLELLNFPPTIVEVAESENSCTNIATSIRYNIFTSRQRSFKTRRYDYQIERVTVELEGASEEKSFTIDSENKTVEVDLQIQVQFLVLENHKSSSVIWLSSISTIFIPALIVHFLYF